MLPFVFNSFSEHMLYIYQGEYSSCCLNQMGSTAGINNEAASNLMQKFWDSAMALGTDDDEETRRLLTVILLC